MYKKIDATHLDKRIVYALYCEESGDLIVVTDSRNLYYGEYVVERGTLSGVRIVWSSFDLQKCVDKANQLTRAAG